ncbi:MAG: hypothetical protein ABR507_08830 [Actinomycetota bacterium]|nr:hypothetical protein [Actinomycetota bacterium]
MGGNDRSNDPTAPMNARVLALILEGFEPDEIAGVLGLDLSAVDTALDELRVVLEVAQGDDLLESVEGRFASMIPAPKELPLADVSDERRVRLLLRLTFEELLRTAEDAELRATMIESTTAQVGTLDETSVRREAHELRMVSAAVKELVSSLLEKMRNG